MESTDPIPEAPGDKWTGLDSALKNGRRGLKGISSLARLLEEYGKKPNRSAMPPLSNRKILAGADAYFARTGKWPNINSGPVAEAPGEDWEWIDQSRRVGTGHLPGGSSLLQLLARKRGVRNPYDMPPLSAEQILAWADAHIQRTGKRPKYDLGPVLDAPGETWAGIDGAVRHGRRSLPVGLPPAKRKRPVALSITHKCEVQIVTEEDIGESGKSPPNDKIARRWVMPSSQVPTQLDNF
jgi:hypothetical protein